MGVGVRDAKLRIQNADAFGGGLDNAPVFFVIALNGDNLLRPFGLAPEVQALSVQFWQPRMTGAPLAVALWGIIGFFNGIGRPDIGFRISVIRVVAILILIVPAAGKWKSCARY